MAWKTPVVLTVFAALGGCAGTASSDLSVTSEREAFAACIGLAEHALTNAAPLPSPADGAIAEPQPAWLILASLDDQMAMVADATTSAEAARMFTIRDAARLTGVVPAGASGFPRGLEACNSGVPTAFSDSGNVI